MVPVANFRVLRRLQVNHLTTAQMSLLLLPLLRRTASLGSIPRLVIVTSVGHHFADIPTLGAKSDSGILPTLNDKGYLTSSVYSLLSLR